jgi:hypothetical protein
MVSAYILQHVIFFQFTDRKQIPNTLLSVQPTFRQRLFSRGWVHQNSYGSWSDANVSKIESRCASGGYTTRKPSTITRQRYGLEAYCCNVRRPHEGISDVLCSCSFGAGHARSRWSFRDGRTPHGEKLRLQNSRGRWQPDSDLTRVLEPSVTNYKPGFFLD